MFKKAMSIMLIVLMVFVAACSGGGNAGRGGDKGSGANQAGASNGGAAKQNEGASSKEQEAEEEEPDPPTEIVIFSQSGDSEESFNIRFGDMLRQKFPQHTFTYLPGSKEYGLKEMIAAGEQIDLYFDSIGFYQPYIDTDIKMDMTELIEKHNIDLSQLEPTVVDSIRMLSDGGIYAVPVFNNNIVLYYNKDIFDKFAKDYPTDGMTWEELNELAKQMTRVDGDTQYFGYATSTTHVLRMNQLSLSNVDENDEATIDKDDRWKKFYEHVFINPMSHYIDFSRANDGFGPYRNEFLLEQNLAMFVWLSSIIFVMQPDFENMNWDMVSLPVFSDNPGVGSQPYPTYFGVTNTSKNKVVATKVIKYLVTEEMQTHLSKIGVMPVLNDDGVKSLLGSESVFKGKNFGAMFYNEFARVPYKGKYEAMGDSPYHHAIWPIRDTGDYNTAHREAAEKLNQAIRDAKGQ